MAGAMIDRAQVARQLKADGLVQVRHSYFCHTLILILTLALTLILTLTLTLQAAELERQAALREGKIKKMRR